MSDIVNLDSLSVKLEQEQIAKFKQWCRERNLDINQVISQFIDGCLEQNIELISDLIPLETNTLSYSKIENMIAESLKPLTNRLEILEQQLENNTIQSSLYVKDNQDKLDTDKTRESEIISTDNLYPNEEERKYLPRHQVWQMLKQTDYVKYCGYDSFLSATPEEFIEYGIFFDTEKKRYYITTESET